MQTLLLVAALLIITVILAVALYIFLQGEHDVRFVTSEKSALTCEALEKDKAVFSLAVPYQNFGKQEGIMTDAIARVLLPKEQFDMAKVTARFENAGARREDGYVEAFIIRINAKGEFILTLEVAPINGHTVEDTLANIVDMTIDIYYEVVGRTRPILRKDSLSLLLEEFQEAAAKGADKA